MMHLHLLRPEAEGMRLVRDIARAAGVLLLMPLLILHPTPVVLTGVLVGAVALTRWALK